MSGSQDTQASQVDQSVFEVFRNRSQVIKWLAGSASNVRLIRAEALLVGAVRRQVWSCCLRTGTMTATFVMGTRRLIWSFAHALTNVLSHYIG